MIIGSGNKVIKPAPEPRRVRRLACAARQRLANLGGELFQGVGLLQKICFEIEHFVAEHGLSSIVGDEQKPGVWPQAREFFGRLSSAHIRHDYVGDDEMNWRAVVWSDREAIEAILSFEDGVTARAKEFHRCFSNRWLVFDQENGL